MNTSQNSYGPDVAQKTILHLHVAAQTVLPISQSLSAHLGDNLLATAHDNGVNLPKSYIDSRVCQRCGSLYIPGVTCLVRTAQSRRQRRRAKDFTWIIYKCKICRKEFRTEIEYPVVRPHSSKTNTSLGIVQREAKSEAPGPAEKKRKRERLQGLKNAIEKAKAQKTEAGFDLLDLMKVE